MAEPNETAVAQAPEPEPDPAVINVLNGVKVKRFSQYRTCSEKDAKGKLCAGHLKRWYFFGDDVKQAYGADAEVYRCERCKTIYLPEASAEPRTGTLRF